MNIGFTFDEKVFMKIDFDQALRKLKSDGASSIELALDDDIMDMDKYVDIARICSRLKLDINYHIPYFISEDYSISNFTKNKTESAKKYARFLDNIAKLSQYVNSKRSTIVVHGEKFEQPLEKTLEHTVDFLKFLIDELDSRNLHQTISIETLRLGQSSVVGDSRYDLIEIIRELDSPRLGICLDICHDSINYFPDKTPYSSDFLSLVNYAHVHGYDLSSDQNHLSLSSSPLNFLNCLADIKKIKPDIILNLESLSDFMGDGYLYDIHRDLSLLQSIV